MAGIKDISNVWQNIKEIDLKPIRESAVNPVRIILVGAPGSGRHTLAEQMRTDPARPVMHTQSTLTLLSVDPVMEIPAAHLIILLADATRDDFSAEKALVRKWNEAGKNVLVFINKIDVLESNLYADAHSGWLASRVVYGSVNDIAFLQREFIPTVLELLPQQQIALGRQFPLFRLTIARQLINETCLSNAAYSFSTGLAEIVPVLDLPLNMTDMVVLTKTQAFLAYKLGLLLGFSTRWQDYVKELGSVIGTGFLWRQLARGLIGLIPAWGIVPKVAVAYSGTYVVGNAVLGWYLTGRKLSPKQMRALYSQSLTRGKEYARKLAGRIPKPRLGKRNKAELAEAYRPLELTHGNGVSQISGIKTEEGDTSIVKSQFVDAPDQQKMSPPELDAKIPKKEKKTRRDKRLHVNWRRRKEVANERICLACGKSSSADASFCQYCGLRFKA